MLNRPCLSLSAGLGAERAASEGPPGGAPTGQGSIVSFFIMATAALLLKHVLPLKEIHTSQEEEEEEAQSLD